MAGDSDVNRLRDRLYARYVTTHSGVSDIGAQAPGFNRDVRPHLPQDRKAHIMDLGCGQGIYVRQLLALGFENTRGVDVSPEQVAAARASGLVQVTVGDYRDSLGVDDLDVVIATDFLEHLTRMECLEALDHVKLSLRPEGILIVRVPNAASPFGGALRYGDLTHEISFTPRSLRQLGLEGGFAQIDIYPCPPPVHGLKSAVRAAAWWAMSGLMKIALVAETGEARGHVVTQNVVAVMRSKAGR